MEKEISEIKYNLVREFDIDFLHSVEAEIEVHNEDDAKNALSMAMQTRKIEKTLEQSRIELTKPHLDYQRSINKLVKDLQEKLNSIEDRLAKKLFTWVSSQQENPFTKIEELSVEDGSLYLTKKWEFEIEDIESIPREFLKVDESMIKDAVRNGVRNISGVKIFQEEKMIMRVKN